MYWPFFLLFKYYLSFASLFEIKLVVHSEALMIAPHTRVGYLRIFNNSKDAKLFERYMKYSKTKQKCAYLLKVRGF